MKNFFEIGADKTLFDGLAISKETALCERYMGKYPVIFISLKGVDGLNFGEACGALRRIREKRYNERLRNDGRTEVLTYGIAFCRKRCKVVCERCQ